MKDQESKQESKSVKGILKMLKNRISKNAMLLMAVLFIPGIGAIIQRNSHYLDVVGVISLVGAFGGLFAIFCIENKRQYLDKDLLTPKAITHFILKMVLAGEVIALFVTVVVGV